MPEARCDHRRNDRSLDGSPPAGPRPLVVAFDDQHVRHVLHATPRDRSLGGEGAPARDHDHRGPDLGERPHDTRGDGVVVMKNPLRAGDPKAAEEDGVMVWLDTPRPARDRSCRVHDREVDLPVRGDAVEERRTVGRRLGEDRRDANERPRVIRGRQPTQPALGLASYRAGVAACAPSADDVRRKPRVEPECVSGDQCACRAGGGLCDPHEVAGGAGPEVGSRPLLECIDEPEVGVHRGVDIVRRNPLADTDPPCELHLRGGQPRCDSADHPSRDPELTFALELSTPLRRLLWMNAVQDERIRQVVALGHVEQAGPQLVILALLEARVVPERMAFEDLALDENGRVEKR